VCVVMENAGVVMEKTRRPKIINNIVFAGMLTTLSRVRRAKKLRIKYIIT
jgi:hypothetical protein